MSNQLHETYKSVCERNKRIKLLHGFDDDHILTIEEIESLDAKILLDEFKAGLARTAKEINGDI